MTQASLHDHEHGEDHVHHDHVHHGGRWIGPAIVGAVALAGCALVNLRDPNETGSWGICPFKVMTGGLDCPGCGLLRGTRALTQGDLVASLDHNVLILPILGGLLFAYGLWVVKSFGWLDRKFRVDVRLAWIAGAVLVGFWIVRNLPWFPYLDSNLS